MELSRGRSGSEHLPDDHVTHALSRLRVFRSAGYRWSLVRVAITHGFSRPARPVRVEDLLY